MFTYTEFFVAHSHILVVFSHAAIMLLGRMNVWKNPSIYSEETRLHDFAGDKYS